MAKVVKKETKDNLKKLYDFFGDNGGFIKTNDPNKWWDLSMETSTDDKTGDMQIVVGIYSYLNGDVMPDPVFHLKAKKQDEDINNIEVLEYYSQTVTGTLHIDKDNNAVCHTYIGSSKEKDPIGIVKRFDEFMHNMCVTGPYLSEPKTVSYYN